MGIENHTISDVKEIGREADGYKEIKPESGITEKQCDQFWKDTFSEAKETTVNHEVSEANRPIENKAAGLEREQEVKADLEKQYPAEEGFEIVPETYLRDKNGAIVKDPETGGARRVDFVVVKDGKIIDSVEVTSKTADKTEQSAKEDRIREAGGNYVKGSDGNLVEIPADVKTRIERRD